MTCTNDNQPTMKLMCEEKNDIDVSVGDFIVVQYDDKRDSGKVINVNNNFKTVRMTFVKNMRK